MLEKSLRRELKNQKYKTSFFMKRTFQRKVFFIATDIIAVVFASILSFYLRFDLYFPFYWKLEFVKILGIFIPLLLIINWLLGLYNITWRYVSVTDVIKNIAGVTLAFLIFLGVGLYGIGLKFPFPVYVNIYVFTLIVSGGARSLKRLYQYVLTNLFSKNYPRRRALIVGAGNAGEQIVRDMKRLKDAVAKPVGIIDDDDDKIGTMIHGVKVLGNRNSIPYWVKKLEVEEIVIAIPSAPAREIRKIVNIAKSTGVKDIKVLPGTNELVCGNVTIQDIRELSLYDLLGRDPVEIYEEEVESFIKGKRVLITGAGGSIGSEISKQVLKFSPSELILLEVDETDLFKLENQLRKDSHDIIISTVVADIKDREKLDRIFQEYLPEIVFHAAAYKHVPIMEMHPEEAVKNNIFGTKNLAELSVKYGVKKFVMISTDKAVNPTSVMGATKRVAEYICQVYNGLSKTEFISVRFGNVLGSRGSVVPIFEEQIKNGGPVTVTHPEMKRYFMLTSEAVLLVLQAGAMGKGGEVFVLDMGEPVKIIDLARSMIELKGLKPDVDILIEFTDPRPGEKLFEELLTAEEGTNSTKHKKIYVAKISEIPNKDFLEEKLSELNRCVKNLDRLCIIKILKELVPTYSPTNNPYWDTNKNVNFSSISNDNAF